MSARDTPIVTRFAPSPTGQLHIGGARTALFCSALARRLGGRFLVRLEDTDRARSSEASAKGILEDLAWLGLDWDDGPELAWEGRTIGGDERSVGPFRQSERLGLYEERLADLIERDLAYPAFDTPAELDAKRSAAQSRKETFVYRRPDGWDREAALARMAAGEDCVIRFRSPADEPVAVADAVLGEVRFGPGEVEDFVIRKRDGFPTYHFAVVVDDGLMGVTHVLRGQEHLANTPKHVLLQRAMGFETPVYAHMPLIFNDKGAKMSKRERDGVAREAAKAIGASSSPTPAITHDAFGAWMADKKRQLEAEQLEALAEALALHLPEVSVQDFRAAGYLPEAVTNFIALLGWTPSKLDDGADREKFDLGFLASDFAIDRIGKSNARFDRVKLASFNQDELAAMDPGEFASRYRTWLDRFDPATLGGIGPGRFAAFCAAVQPRCKTFTDGAEVGRFALIATDEIAYDEKAVKKWLRKGEPSGLATLADLAPALERIDPWEPAAIEAAVSSFCEERGVGMGKAAQPLRVALTGAAVSPALGETLALIGKDEVVARVARCMESCSAEHRGEPAG